MLLRYSSLVLLITKFFRFGVGIFLAPLSNCRYSESASAFEVVAITAVGDILNVIAMGTEIIYFSGII